MLLQAQQECRADIGRIDDPKAQAFFETVAEVVGGLFKALEHYQAGSEPAWQTSGQKETGRRTMVEHMPKDQRIQPQGTQPSVVTDMAPDISEDYPLRNCSQNKCKLYPARNIMNRHFGKCGLGKEQGSASASTIPSPASVPTCDYFDIGGLVARAMDVIYLPRSERISHYFSVRLPEQFDATIHFDDTRAVEALDGSEQWDAGEPPETYPTSV